MAVKATGYNNSSIKTQTIGAGTTLQNDGALEVAENSVFLKDLDVGGDLSVTGDIISRGAVDLVVDDNFIDLNFNNVSTTSESGGITVSMNRTSGFTASTVTTFVAGVKDVSNPTFTVTDATGSSLLAANDVVMISLGTTGVISNEGNMGLYQVKEVNQASFPQIVTICGTGTVAVDGSLPFCQTQFAAETGATGSACKIDLAVWAVADGTSNFLDSAGANYAKGSFITAYATSAVLSDFDGNGDYTVAAATRQSAYDGGATIITAGGVAITNTLTNGNFVVSGAGQAQITPTGAAQLTSGAALTITGGEASTWSTSGSANLNITAGGALTCTSGGVLGLIASGSIIDVTANSLSPNANDTSDLGTASNGWKDLFLSESLEFIGASGENEIVLVDNLADALSITDGTDTVLQITTSTGTELIEAQIDFASAKDTSLGTDNSKCGS